MFIDHFWKKWTKTKIVNYMFSIKPSDGEYNMKFIARFKQVVAEIDHTENMIKASRKEPHQVS